MTKLEKEYLKLSKELSKLAIGKAINAAIKEGTKGFVQLHAYKERLLDVISKDTESQICYRNDMIKMSSNGKPKDEIDDFEKSELYKFEKEMIKKIDDEINKLSKAFSNINHMEIELKNYRIAE